MAGADRLNEKILEEAKLKAQENIENAESEAEEILNEAQVEADARKEKIIQGAYEEAENIKKRMIAVAQLEARKQKLQAKQEMVERAFSKTLEKISMLSSEKYQNLLEDMIIQAVRTGEEEIVLSEKDKQRVNESFIENINKGLKKKELKSNVKLSNDSASINGGFILKSGNVEMNNSFETIIRMSRDKMESEVVKILFGL